MNASQVGHKIREDELDYNNQRLGSSLVDISDGRAS